MGRKPIDSSKRVAPRIVKKPAGSTLRPEEEYVEIDTKKAVAFGMDLVRQMKAEAAAKEAEAQKKSILPATLGERPTSRTKGKASEKFPAADLKEFKKLLLKARVEAMNGAEAMKATGFNEAEDHEADGGDGTAQTMRLQALGQMGNMNRTIQQIDEALHRIDDGSYGVCTACGKLIRKARLLNQPFVLTCMECQSEMERSAK